MSSESSITSRAEESSDDENVRVRTEETGRGRGRGRRRGVRGGVRGVRGTRGSGRGRGRSRGSRTQGPTRDVLALEEVNRRTDVLQEEISQMESEELKQLCLKMAEKHPSLVHDILRPAPQQGGYHPQPGGASPDWCVCGKCREMPTNTEKVCCRKERCVTLLPDFAVLILDEAVLALGRIYRRDVLVFDDDADWNKANRHQGYRQYVLWTHGRLGAGDRRVIPSCCVWQIRDKYPDPFGQYTGFVPGRLG
ncbi:P2X purinoceptor 7-like [Saccostrea cucullata]|uniref:P2X purinoceptor 7-like n=1 Tax=Saccostrea cuccullata TaxID=36930 RepID=UPI002ED1814D